MIKQLNSEFLAPTKKLRRLSVLLTIENNSSMSQHAIGKLACLSSAMVNNYIKELQRDGLIIIAGNNNRTQTYHLTDSGKKEFRELLHSYSEELVNIYGNAQHELRQIEQLSGCLSKA